MTIKKYAINWICTHKWIVESISSDASWKARQSVSKKKTHTHTKRKASAKMYHIFLQSLPSRIWHSDMQMMQNYAHNHSQLMY